MLICISISFFISRYIKDNFNNPEVLIIRNGWSDFGEFIDLDRIEYLRAHLKELLNSILNDGCNISGYTGADDTNQNA